MKHALTFFTVILCSLAARKYAPAIADSTETVNLSFV